MTPPKNGCSNWWQLEIDDESALSGEATARLLDLLTSHTGLRHVWIRRAEGSGGRISELIECEHGVVIDKLVSLLQTVVQLDWGDFFLTSSELQAQTISSEDDYPTALRKCGVLLRAVDDTYFYIYGRDEALKNVLLSTFPTAVMKSGAPEDLDYPD